MAVVRGLLGASVGGLLLGAIPMVAQAQTGTVTGRVIDSTSQQPISSVAVRIDGTQLGTLTREDGSFTIAGVPTGARSLRVSRIGFAAQVRPLTVAAGTNPAITLQLRQLVAQLSEVVAVGYGTQRRESVTSAVSSINADQAKVGVQPNVNTMIQGRAAGVQITQNSGDPGSGTQIRVRGGTSLSGGNEPLYVIDGVPIQNDAGQVGQPGLVGSGALPRSPLNLLNPEDIADITILKDASATAIYGSRGANGVVLIQTKRGAAGVSTVDYNGYVGAASTARRLDLLSASEYRNFIQQQVTLRQSDSTKGLPASALTNLGTASTNWQDEVQRTAYIQNQNVAFAGGSQATQYRASLNYFDQPGTIINTGFSRYQGRLNGTSRLLGDKLNLNLNLTASQTNDRYGLAENTGGFAGGVFTNVLQFNPTLPVTVTNTETNATNFYEIGSGAQNVRNPVAILSQVNDRGITNRTLGNIDGSYTLLPSLTASVNVGVDKSTGDRSTYVPTTSPIAATTSGYARRANRDLATSTVRTLLTYDNSFDTKFLGLGRQNLNVVGGYEYQHYRVAEFGGETQGFTNDATGANNLGGGIAANPPFSNLSYRNLTSFFGRVNYGLKDKYYVTGVVRRDGSSVFGANNKYAVFPAVSASWRISQEPFFRNIGFISELKLRGGYGTQGNQAINPYQTLSTLATGAGFRYPFGTGIVTGVLPNVNPNPNLKWEETRQSDVAIDFGLLSNRLTGTVEYYSKITTDLLYNVPVPPPAVAGNQFQNIGKLKAAGFEGTLDFQAINQPGRTLSFGVVASVDRNRVVNLGGQNNISTGTVNGPGLSGTPIERIIVGQSLPVFYAPEFLGIVNGVQQFNKYDATGKRTGTTTSPSGDDYRIIGNPNPKFTGGFRGNATFSGVDLSFLVRGQSGFNVFNNTSQIYSTKSVAKTNQNFLRAALTDGLDINEPGIYSSRWIEDGSFIRLQNVTLGYTLNLKSIARRITSARVYVSGDNLLLGTSYSGPDPEVFVDGGLATRGIDYLTYPRARTYTFGLTLGL